MNDISKAKVNLYNLLNIKDSSVQSIIEEFLNTVDTDFNKELEKLKKSLIKFKSYL